MLAGCSGADRGDSRTEDSSAPATSTCAPNGLVQHRAAHPVDVRANGLQPIGDSFTVPIPNDQQIVLQTCDWNTISNSSSVQRLVGSELDVEFHASDTTRNRFQYLADLIAQRSNISYLYVAGIAASQQGSQLMLTAYFYNPTPNRLLLSNVAITIRDGSPPLHLLASETFFASSDTALIVPARTVHFADLPFESFSPPVTASQRFSFNYPPPTPVD